MSDTPKNPDASPAPAPPPSRSAPPGASPDWTAVEQAMRKAQAQPRGGCGFFCWVGRLVFLTLAGLALLAFADPLKLWLMEREIVDIDRRRDEILSWAKGRPADWGDVYQEASEAEQAKRAFLRALGSGGTSIAPSATSGTTDRPSPPGKDVPDMLDPPPPPEALPEALPEASVPSAEAPPPDAERP